MELLFLETLKEENIKSMLIITLLLLFFLIICKKIFEDKILEQEGMIYNIIIGFERTIGGIIAIILSINLISIFYYFFIK